MRKWEYDEKHSNAVDFWSDLKKLGLNGWEVIQYQALAYNKYLIFVKRELDD